MSAQLVTIEAANEATIVNAGCRSVTPAILKFLDRSFREQIKRCSHTVIIDISDWLRLDSRSIGILIGWVRLAHQEDRRLVLCGLDRHKRTVLELVRFHEVVDIFNERAQALAFLGSRWQRQTIVSADPVRKLAASAPLVRAASSVQG